MVNRSGAHAARADELRDLQPGPSARCGGNEFQTERSTNVVSVADRTAAQVSDRPPLPPGLLIAASHAAIAPLFPLLADLQPVRWRADGLVCAPRARPDGLPPALSLDAIPLPSRRLAEVPAWPSPPAAWVAGWYRRSAGHAPAPPGVPELIQASGAGFELSDHPTTAMCLAALPDLPPGPALDVGCGSGLLVQAWAALARGPALAVDLDSAAVDQTRRSLAAAGLSAAVEVRRTAAAALTPFELDGRVLLANVPAQVHLELLERVAVAPPAAVLSGLRIGEGARFARRYRLLGLRPVSVARSERWERWTLVRDT